MMEELARTLLPGTPAFWDAGAVRRPSVARAAWSFEEAGKCVTTLLARAAASY